MKAFAYVHGKPLPLQGVSNPGSIVLEVVLDDDRTVQLVVRDNGEIQVRGWGNTPILLGNGNQVEFMCRLAHEEQTYCPRSYTPIKDCKCRDHDEHN